MENYQKSREVLSKIFLVLAIFSIGFFSSILLHSYTSQNTENPLSFFLTQEVKSPSDTIQENQISIYKDKIVIKIEDASLSKYADTGSMRPLFDKGANGIRIVPKSSEDINIGDIITFERDGDLIVHRLIEKGQDDQGIYFITKGDNNNFKDGKIRFSDIKYVTIGILY